MISDIVLPDTITARIRRSQRQPGLPPPEGFRLGLVRLGAYSAVRTGVINSVGRSISQRFLDFNQAGDNRSLFEAKPGATLRRSFARRRCERSGRNRPTPFELFGSGRKILSLVMKFLQTLQLGSERILGQFRERQARGGPG